MISVSGIADLETPFLQAVERDDYSFAYAWKEQRWARWSFLTRLIGSCSGTKSRHENGKRRVYFKSPLKSLEALKGCRPVTVPVSSAFSAALGYVAYNAAEQSRIRR
jgi:hypothetical protein